ncbi:MAG: glycosyltransferase [Minicystis sp.]
MAGGPERGAEAYAEALRERARGLDVTWIGEVPDAGPFLADLDVFAMISEPAGCPNASIEAMAAGLPVVATDVGGAADQVVDGVTGRLVPRDDAAALAAALVQIARDPALRRRFGEAGRARAEDRFDLRRMAADYRRVCLGDAAHAEGASARTGLGDVASETP